MPTKYTFNLLACNSNVKKDPNSSIDYNSHITACPDCDLLVAKLPPPEGHKTKCPRCGRILLQHCHETVARSLALALTGLLLYVPAIFMPLLTFQRLGLSESGNILQTIGEFIKNEYYFVAVAVFLSTVVFPLLKLSLLTFVSFSLKLRYFPVYLGKLFRIYNHLEEWAMVEVFLLGIMITIIKMHSTTDIYFNIGFYCFVGLVVITMGSSLTVCKESYWMLIESKGEHWLQQYLPRMRSSSAFAYQTAASNDLMLCRDCGKLTKAAEANSAMKPWCRRCGASLHFRKPASLSRTWALILCAALLMFPANLLPIMRVDFLGIPSNSTILDGIKLFFQDGSYIIALIILTASILIPIFKIIGLTIVLLTIQFKRKKFLRQKTAMYRFIEFIGRWSMLDIFVIALLGFFINFGFLTSIKTAPAATYFCLVVITTMFATLTFDPRIMWDAAAKEQSHMDSVPHSGE